LLNGEPASDFGHSTKQVQVDAPHEWLLDGGFGMGHSAEELTEGCVECDDVVATVGAAAAAQKSNRSTHESATNGTNATLVANGTTVLANETTASNSSAAVAVVAPVVHKDTKQKEVISQEEKEEKEEQEEAAMNEHDLLTMTTKKMLHLFMYSAKKMQGATSLKEIVAGLKLMKHAHKAHQILQSKEASLL
jgi:hypothetical protein